jgi:hypothetical protein
MAPLMLVLRLISFELMNVDMFATTKLPVLMEAYNYPACPRSRWNGGSCGPANGAASTTVNGIASPRNR